MKKLLVTLGILGSVMGGYFLYASAQVAIYPFGAIKVQHTNGSWTTYAATTSSDVGRGTALSTAVGSCQFKDVFYLSGQTYDLGDGTLQKMYSCQSSIHGTNATSTIIKSTAHSSSGISIPEILELGDNSGAYDLTVIAPNQSASNFQMCILENGLDTTIRNVNCTSGSDGIWRQGTSTTLFDNVKINTAWDGLDIIQSSGTTTLSNTQIIGSTTAAINSGQETRCILNGSGPLYIYNSNFDCHGGSSDNYAIFTVGNFISPASTYFLNGSVHTAGSGTNYDIYNFDTGGHISKTYIGANVSYDPTKLSGTLSPYQVVSSAGSFNAMTSTATSSIAGGLTVQSNKLVINNSNGNLGVGVTTPIFPFQIGYAFTVSAPGTLSSTQSYDNLGECYTADNDTVVGHLYAYRTDPATSNQVSSMVQTFTFTDNNSGSTYTNHWSWSAASGAEGYWLEVEDQQTNAEFDNWIQLGQVTSYADDGCTNVGEPSFEAQTQPYFVTDSSGHSGFGVVPSTGNNLSILNSNTAALDIYSANNTGGNNSSGDIRIIDPSTNNIIFKVGGTGSGTGSAFIQQGSQTISNQILSEWDVANSSTASGDKRMVVIQGLTDTTKDNAQWIVAPANGGGGTPILMEIRGSIGHTAFSSTNLAYGANMASVVTDYGNLSVGSAYTNTAAPTDGVIIVGNTGIGTSSPLGTLSVQATSSTQTGPIFVVASSTRTDLVVTNKDTVGIGTSSPDSTLDVNGSIRLEGNSTIVTSSISGAITGIGCDSTTTASPITLASTTAFITTPQHFPGNGLNWFSYAASLTTIKTMVCSDVTVTPEASTYNVKIIK